MKKKHIISGAFKEFIYEDKVYINKNKKNIAKSNLDLVKKMTLVYLCALILYFVVFLVWCGYKPFSFVFVAFIFVQILYSIYVWKFLGKRKIVYNKIQNTISLFGIFIMSFVTLTSIFNFKDEAGIFFSPLLICMAVLYIYPFSRIFLRVTFYEIVFIVLSLIFKSSDAIVLDVVGSTTAWIIAVVSAFVICDLQLKNGKINSELKRISGTDQLTGLVNKVTFEYICRNYIRNKIFFKPWAMMILDIDDYKEINDNFGHQLGDEILKEVANVLRESVRNDDVIGRFGGDEFIVFMKELDERAVLEYRAETICRRFREIKIMGISKKITCSIGAIINNNKVMGYDETLALADKTLYDVKTEGKDNYKIHI